MFALLLPSDSCLLLRPFSCPLGEGLSWRPPDILSLSQCCFTFIDMDIYSEPDNICKLEVIFESNLRDPIFEKSNFFMRNSWLLMIYTLIIEMRLRVEDYLGGRGLLLPQGSTLEVSVGIISNGFENLSLFRPWYQIKEGALKIIQFHGFSYELCGQRPRISGLFLRGHFGWWEIERPNK